jgi:hypothetical protein
MNQSEKSKSDESSSRDKTLSIDTAEYIGDFEINIPYENFYSTDELFNLKAFYQK